MTRLGDLLHFGQLFEACGNSCFAQIAHIFCKVVKILHFYSEIILGSFYRVWATFYRSRWTLTCHFWYARITFWTASAASRPGQRRRWSEGGRGRSGVGSWSRLADRWRWAASKCARRCTVGTERVLDPWPSGLREKGWGNRGWGLGGRPKFCQSI